MLLSLALLKQPSAATAADDVPHLLSPPAIGEGTMKRTRAAQALLLTLLVLAGLTPAEAAGIGSERRPARSTAAPSLHSLRRPLDDTITAAESRCRRPADWSSSTSSKDRSAPFASGSGSCSTTPLSNRTRPARSRSSVDPSGSTATAGCCPLRPPQLQASHDVERRHHVRRREGTWFFRQTGDHGGRSGDLGTSSSSAAPRKASR